MELKKTLVVGVVFGILSGALSLALPLYLDAQGYSVASIGWIFGAATLISGLLGIGLGALSDRFGRRPLLAFYNIVIGAATLIIGWVTGIYAFILGKALGNFGNAGLWNALLSRVSDISRREDRALHIGKYIGLFGISYAIAHWFAGVALDAFGFLFLFTGVIGLTVIGAGVSLMFNEMGKRSKRANFSFEVLKGRNGRVNALVSFMHGIGNGLVYAYIFYIFLAKEYLFTPTQIGIFIAVTFSIWGVSAYFMGRIVDRLGMRKSVLLGGILNGLSWVGVAIFSTQFWPFAFFIAMDNLTYPLFSLAAVKMSSVIPREENVGRDLSVFGYAHVLGSMVAISVAGMVAEISYVYVFLGRAAVFILIGLVVWYGIKLRD